MHQVMMCVLRSRSAISCAPGRMYEFGYHMCMCVCVSLPFRLALQKPGLVSTQSGVLVGRSLSVSYSSPSDAAFPVL